MGKALIMQNAKEYSWLDLASQATAAKCSETHFHHQSILVFPILTVRIRFISLASIYCIIICLIATLLLVVLLL